MVESKIIIPLDGMTQSEALLMAEQLSGAVWGFKVNDLLLACGVSIIEKLKRYGRVFADAKLHDIPNTVGNSIRQLEDGGADIITVHASGGIEMLRKAAAEAKRASVIAVTVLTSLTPSDTQEIFVRTPGQAVLDLARLVRRAGLGGIVCSPAELDLLAADAELKQLIKVTPGVRPMWYQKGDDQRRTKTPREALDAGATYLVIGRPITGHDDPRQAVGLVDAELAPSPRSL